MMLADKFFGRSLAAGALMLSSVIALGVALYLAIQWLSVFCGATPAWSKMAAVAVSSTTIFFLNQLFTHNDQRLAGVRLLHRMIFFLVLMAGMASLDIEALRGALEVLKDSWSASFAGAFNTAVLSYGAALILSRQRPSQRKVEPEQAGVSIAYASSGSDASRQGPITQALGGNASG